MRLTTALALVLLLTGPARAYEPLLGREMGGGLSEAARPVYRAAEGLSDRVYRLMRGHLFEAFLPGRLARSLETGGTGDSYARFSARLAEKEDRLLLRLRESYPGTDSLGRTDPARLAEWRGRASGEQVSVVLDAFKDTMIERHRVDRFGRATDRYARDPRNWDAEFLAAAGFFGGTFLYLNGLHAAVPLGGARLAVDLRSGHRIARALRSGERATLGSAELGHRGTPVHLACEWEANRGRVQVARYGLNYRLRY